MSTRSHFEINHDIFPLKATDKEIADAFRAYVRSAGREQAAALEQMGVTRFWWGHHSDIEVEIADMRRRRINRQ